MPYDTRKTQLSDLEYLPIIERSASNAFKRLPDLAWLVDGDVVSVSEHRRLIEQELSWVAYDTISQDIMGFIIGEIIEDHFYIAEISVSEFNQQKGIGSTLFSVALAEAKSLGLSTATLTTFIDVAWNAPYYERLGFIVLKNDDLPSYLQNFLQEEKKAGLPPERRCAMSKSL